MLERISPFPPAQNFGRYEPLPPVMPEALTHGATFDQLARPFTSETRTFHDHGEPPVISTCPAILSFADVLRLVVPIPTVAFAVVSHDA